MGGVFFLFWGNKLNNKKITKIKYNKGLRWLLFDILHTTTNQKHAGVMEGGWDRPRDRARTLGERDGNDEPLAVGDNDDDDDDDKDSNIPNDDDKYAIGLMVLTCPLMRATRSMIFSALPPHKRALRVSGRACPHAESIILSASSAESMILSACAGNIILSAQPAESMILSQRHPGASVP
jgi:hypothetical protein